MSWWDIDWSSPTPWSRPLTFGGIVTLLALGLLHFGWQYSREGGMVAYCSSQTSSPHVRPATLLVYRSTVFVLTAYLLVTSTLEKGPDCLRYFTVWNFIVLVACFAFGTGLSCRHMCLSEASRRSPSASHRVAAVIHHLLLEIELPMSAMIGAVVWLVLYPYDKDNPLKLLEYTNLTSLSMHGFNFFVLLIEFGLNALDVRPEHIGLFIAWGMLYALFNGLQAFWTGDTVYFFMDFTLAKAPIVAALLFCLMCLIFVGACGLSRLKWQLLERRPVRPLGSHEDLTATLLTDALLPPEPRSLLEAARKLWRADETGSQDAAGAPV